MQTKLTYPLIATAILTTPVAHVAGALRYVNVASASPVALH